LWFAALVWDGVEVPGREGKSRVRMTITLAPRESTKSMWGIYLIQVTPVVQG
jgi:hypothetical protein